MPHGKIARSLLLALLGLITPLVVAGTIYSVRSQTIPTPFRPFVVTSIMSTPTQNSPYLQTSTFARAVRSDGSWVLAWVRDPSSRYKNEREIHDYETGVYTIVDDTTNSIVRESIPTSEYKHRLMPAMSCEGVSAGKILGLAVNYKEETGDMGAANGYQWEASTLIKEWLATDLGCFVLQKESIWTRKSDGFILVDTKLTPISVSFQPTDEFFQIPTSYTERTKKEARALYP